MIWVKFHDFTKVSKQITLDKLVNSDEDIYQNALTLFNKLWNPDSDKKIRAICVGVSNLTDVYKVQLSLLENQKDEEKNNNIHLEKAINNIKEKYGDASINYADKV